MVAEGNDATYAVFTRSTTKNIPVHLASFVIALFSLGLVRQSHVELFVVHGY
jgi:hypothetical protein